MSISLNPIKVAPSLLWLPSNRVLHPNMTSQRPLTLNYDASVYIAVTLTPKSAYMHSPIVLPAYPSVTRVGDVRPLKNVRLLSIPKSDWLAIRSEVLRVLREDTANIEDAQVQVPKPRTKRA